MVKSLWIVNEKVKYYKDTIEELLNKNEEYPNPFIHLTLDPLEETLKQWETIKQDLEVLEIIYKKKIIIEHIKTKLECWENLEALLEFWNGLTSHKDSQLTMEELLKLKQWLEVNE